jgi:hypothetical protein
VGTLHWDETKKLFKNYTVANCYMLNRPEQKINILTSNAQLLMKDEMSFINSIVK